MASFIDIKSMSNKMMITDIINKIIITKAINMLRKFFICLLKKGKVKETPFSNKFHIKFICVFYCFYNNQDY